MRLYQKTLQNPAAAVVASDDILGTDATLELLYNHVQAFLGKASDGTQLLLARTQ